MYGTEYKFLRTFLLSFLTWPTTASSTSSMGSITCNGATGTEMKEFTAMLPSQNLEPLWSRMSDMVPSTPNPRAMPHVWKYKDVFPHLSKAGQIVPEQMAERRVLMLVNPNLGEFHHCNVFYTTRFKWIATYQKPRCSPYNRHDIWRTPTCKPRGNSTSTSAYCLCMPLHYRRRRIHSCRGEEDASGTW